MSDIKVEVVVGITGSGSELEAYELVVRFSRGGRKFVSPRQRRISGESWGDFLLKSGDWLDEQAISFARGSLVGKELLFSFKNGEGVLAPVSPQQYEMFKGAIGDNLRSRLLEGRLS